MASRHLQFAGLGGLSYLTDCLIVSAFDHPPDVAWIERGIYSGIGILFTVGCFVAGRVRAAWSNLDFSSGRPRPVCERQSPVQRISRQLPSGD
jgi:hypothetical protein